MGKVVSYQPYTETDRLLFWIENDEELYDRILSVKRFLKLSTNDAIPWIVDMIEDALGFDELTPMQLEFMPDLQYWYTVDKLQDFYEELDT